MEVTLISDECKSNEKVSLIHVMCASIRMKMVKLHYTMQSSSNKRHLLSCCWMQGQILLV